MSSQPSAEGDLLHDHIGVYGGALIKWSGNLTINGHKIIIDVIGWGEFTRYSEKISSEG